MTIAIAEVAPAASTKSWFWGSALLGTGKMLLTARELVILRQLLCGSTNRQIAANLSITEAAVKAQLTRLYRKIDVANRLQAIMWARNNGIE